VSSEAYGLKLKKLLVAAGGWLVDAEIDADLSGPLVKGCFDKVCMLIVC